MRHSKILWEKKLNTLAGKILVALKKKNAFVEVFLLPDVTMRQLERTYMKKEKKIVDVLSFAEPEGFPHPEVRTRKPLGQVYLNWELHPADLSRLRFLLVHGILHILGYDHERKRDSIEMEALEQKVLAALDSGKKTRRARTRR